MRTARIIQSATNPVEQALFVENMIALDKRSDSTFCGHAVEANDATFIAAFVNVFVYFCMLLYEVFCHLLRIVIYKLRLILIMNSPPAKSLLLVLR